MNNSLFENINHLSDLFSTICNSKNFIVKLQLKELANFKRTFYDLNFPDWQLNLLWEMIWNDRTVSEVACVFYNKKLLKVGDVVGQVDRFEKEKNNC